MHKNNRSMEYTSLTARKNTLCFVAGRSGGHIKPALTLAKRAKKKDATTIVFISTMHELDKQIIQSSNVVDVHVALDLENLPKKFWHYPCYCYKLLRTTITSLLLLQKEKPSNIVSMGGYISLPVCLAARLLNIPIELYELNATPGKATKILAPLSSSIQVPFKHALKSFDPQKSIWTAYPLAFSKKDKFSKQEALEVLHLSLDKKTLLILGGSQGSIFINSLMKCLNNAPSLSRKLQIIHQTGSNDSFDWKSFYTQHNIPSRVFTYSDSISLYYNAADVIICRAGAGTLFEALFFQKPCIVIPLETKSTAHQHDNALAMKEEYPELFTILNQKDLEKKPSLVINAIKNLIF